MQSKKHPYTASSAASTPLEALEALEALAEAADGNGWFQLYVSGNADVTEGLVSRAEAAGYPVLMVTADVPAAGKRDLLVRFKSGGYKITGVGLLTAAASVATVGSGARFDNG